MEARCALLGHVPPGEQLGGFMKRTPKARVGEMAHEFAHLVDGWGSPYPEGGPEAEARPDNLAREWGFTEEIAELNQS